MALTQQFTAGSRPTATKLNESSIPVVSATSDITAPFTGQVIFNTTDAKLYRYTGSAWAIFVGGHTWQVRRAAAQPIGNSSFTDVLFDTDDNDTGNFHSVVVGSQMNITIGQAGLYAISGKVGWVASATGIRVGRFVLNGAVIPGSTARGPNAGADFAAVTMPTMYQQCIVGDVLKMQVWQNSGGALNLNGGADDNTIFTGAWLHD